MVLIPFIAGQWSLPARGARPPGGGKTGLNPLHCGAVVASSPPPKGGGDPFAPVLIPFIAGQWSLRRGEDALRKALPAS